SAALRDRWWQDGVVRQLTTAQEQNLRKSMEKSQGKDRIEFIDAGHFPRIVIRNFDGAFQGVFSDFQKTQSWLMQVASARHDWAHPRTGDLLVDDVAHALYAMVQILSTAKLPEAAEVERIRKDVLGMEPAPATGSPSLPTAARPAQASPAPAGALP